jgi:hypothetical protein
MLPSQPKENWSSILAEEPCGMHGARWRRSRSQAGPGVPPRAQTACVHAPGVGDVGPSPRRRARAPATSAHASPRGSCTARSRLGPRGGRRERARRRRRTRCVHWLLLLVLLVKISEGEAERGAADAEIDLALNQPPSESYA